jgi:protein SCO1/2
MRRSVTSLRRAVAFAAIAVSAAVALMFGAQTAIADPGDSLSGSAADFDTVVPLPPTYRGSGVKIDEHLGATLPMDARFRTSDGKDVTLGDVLRGDLPTIVTFNYSDCPQLCSLQLNGLTAAMPAVAADTPPLLLGKHFRIVTIDLEPNEPLVKLAAMKLKYVQRLAQLGATGDFASGWTFLAAASPGDDASIRRVADVVGFHYAYVPEHAEWAHPAALMFVSNAGVLTRYVYGIEYATPMMRESIFKAGMNEPATAVGYMFRCYHYDPEENSYAHAGVVALRLAAGGAVVMLLGALGIVHLLRRAGRSTPKPMRSTT